VYLATPATASRCGDSRLCFAFSIAIAISFLLLCATSLSAQQDKPKLQDKTQTQPQDDQSVTTIKKNVNVVNVLATVRNKDGKIVSTLNKDDFKLEVDGKPQDIRYFSRVTDTPLTLGLLVDTSLSVRRVLDKERTASYVFLNDLLNETKDKAFIIHFDFEIELLQDLTSSRPKLENALQKLQVGNPRQIQTSDPNDPNQGGQRGGGTKLYDAIFLASDEITGKVQGRKALIILSDGVDQGSKVGMGRAIEAAQRADTLIYTILFVDSDANNNNVAGYPGGRQSGGGYPGRGYPGGGYPGGGRQGGGYPGGGYPGGGGGGGGYPGGGGGGGRGRGGNHPIANGKEVMKQLALQTGGRFFEVSKHQTIDDIYKTIGEELRNQYNLGFTPELANDKEGDFHKITVTTSQKDMTVQAREGYYSGK
jgi:VWFA-related protein